MLEFPGRLAKTSCPGWSRNWSIGDHLGSTEVT
jgi:hypothetical protein